MGMTGKRGVMAAHLMPSYQLFLLDTIIFSLQLWTCCDKKYENWQYFIPALCCLLTAPGELLPDNACQFKRQIDCRP